MAKAREDEARRSEPGWLRTRRALGGRAISAMFEGMSAVARLHPAARPSAHDLEVLEDLSYGPDRRHRLDVWRRRTPSPAAPALLFIHGGGFRILSKKTHWLMALAFARAGYVVFTIDYRLAPTHPFPAAVEDVASAYRWVLENAERYGADPHRVVVSGESAGANLTLALALCTCTRRPEPFASATFEAGRVPAALLPLCGFMQVTEPDRFQRERRLGPLVADRIQVVSSDYLGDYGIVPRPETALADPVRLLEARDLELSRPLPPTYLAVGGRDPIAEDTLRTATALERLGVPVELDVYPGEPHAFHALVWRAAAQRCWTAQLAFLSRHAPIEPDPEAPRAPSSDPPPGDRFRRPASSKGRPGPRGA